MPPVGFKPAIPTSEQPQTHALDRAATGIDAKVSATRSFENNIHCSSHVTIT